MFKLDNTLIFSPLILKGSTGYSNTFQKSYIQSDPFYIYVC